MAAPKNVFNDEYRNLEADAAALKAPAPAGTVIVTPVNDGIVTLDQAGTYTLQDPRPAQFGVPIGVTVLIIARATVTIQGQGMTDLDLVNGEHGICTVYVDSSGNRAWRKEFAATASATDQADITDSSGGTSSNTVGAVSGSGADGAINDNFATVLNRLNAVTKSLRKAGLFQS